MTGLPTGTVTLLFTDIEGSTRLAATLGGRWAEVLAAQRRIVRAAVAAHGGHEVDVQGDGFFIAFKGAAEAAAAAADCQRTIAAHEWPADGLVRLRMGIHSGEPTLTEDGYAGLDVHKAARVCGAAHGGQVLLSQATRSLFPDRGARDLGEFRLKDLTAAERLFQLEVEGVESKFLPPRSLRATNLPMQPLPLIGRREEVKAGLDLLHDGVRLFTLTGSGGTGKTRLALELAARLAHDFRDGVHWVPLSSIDDPERVPDVIASFIGAPVESDGLMRFVRDRELLLLLDNFEHVLPAAAVVAELLATAPKLRVIATSRAPLHLTGEHEFPVAPLPDQAALELFTARARAVRPDFAPGETSAAICRRLDCIPLALELAAARLKHIGEATLLARLDHSLDVLSDGPRDLPERQRTLRDVIEWSYRLLRPEEQRLLDRMAVFAGRVTLEQAERACGGDGVDVLAGISSLVDNSLLRWFVSTNDPEHYFMLESVREFALERLGEDGEEPTIRRRHRDVFLALADELDPVDHLTGIRALVPERNNLRAALRWSVDNEGGTEETLRLGFHLWRYWLETGSITEGREWLDAALVGTEDADPVLRARALDAAGFLAAQKGDFAAALDLNDQSLAIARNLDDFPSAAGWALFRRGVIQLDRGALEEAGACLRDAASIFRDQRWADAEGWTLIELYRGEMLSCRVAAARQGFAEVLELIRRDEEPIAPLYAQALLGCALSLEGDPEQGLVDIEEGLNGLRRLGAGFTLVNALLHAAPAFRLAGERVREHEAMRDALQLSLDSGIVPRATACLEGAARLAVDGGEHLQAARLWGAADQICKELGIALNPLRLQLRREFEETARTSLGEDAYAQEFERGRRLALVEGLELALATVTGLHEGIDEPVGEAVG